MKLLQQRLLTLVVWLSFVHCVQAQEWTQQMQQSNPNFNTIKKSFDNYWKDRPYERGRGYKQYKRWEYFWEKRLLPNGNFPQAGIKQQEWSKYLQTHPNSNKQRTTNNTTGNWTSLGPNSSPGGYQGVGRINCVAFHPSNVNVFYVGTPAGGLWRTTDGGNSWSCLTDNLPIIGVSSVVIHPTNTNTIYIATGDADGGDTPSIGVMKSTDGGANWSKTGLDWSMSQGRKISVLLMHPADANTLIAATSSGIYKTTNAGGNWTNTKTGNFRDMEFKPGAPATIYATGRDGSSSAHQVFVSSDTGASWTKSTNFSGVNRIAIAVSPANDGLVAVLNSGNDNGFAGFYVSTNSGASFTEKFSKASKNLLGWKSDGSDNGGQGWYDLTLAISPTNASEMFVGGVNTWKSTDGGASWNLNSHWSWGGAGIPVVHADKHFLMYHPQQTGTLFECNDGGIYKTTNGGTSWTDLTNGMVHTQFYKIGVSQTDASYVVAGAQDNGTKLRGGTAWTNIGGGDGMECIIDPTDKDIQYYSIYNGKVTRKVNGTRKTISDNVPGRPKGAWVTPYVLDPSDPKTIVIGYQDVFRSNDRGDSWTNISNGQTGTANLNAVAIAPSNSNTIYAASYYKMYRTTNASSWTNITAGLPVSSGSITYIVVSPSDPNTLWVTISGYSSGKKVYKSTNGGSSWTNISGTLPNLPVNCILLDEVSSDESLYIGTDVGIFYRNNTLGDWQAFSNGLPNVVVRELEIQRSSKKLRAGTYGRGLWESDLYGVASAANPPVVTSFTPASGNVGTVVTIQGNFFTGATAVKFNGTTATVFNVVSDSKITATVPAGTTTGKISVITPGGTGNSAANFIIEVLPKIISFTPGAGNEGMAVVITGENFGATIAANTVKFNGTVAIVSSASPTQLDVTVPARATTGKITVEVNGKTATSATDFVITTNNSDPVITDFTPKAGTIDTEVVITGANFDPTATNNTVKFNGTVAIVTAATATELKVTVPNGATTGKITVEVGGKTATSTADFTIIENAADLAIADFTPKSGIIGTEVTIIGVNFDPVAANNTVKFNGTEAVVTAATTTELKTNVPVGATTGKISVEVGDKIATSTADFTVTENATDPAIADFTPKEGAKDTVVTIFGNNFDAIADNNTVKFNGTVAVVIAGTTTELKATVPAGATTGKISVEVSGVTATSTADFTVLDDSKALQFNIKPAKVITPNGDMINDTWKIEGIEKLTDYHIRVFSKTGQLVYESTKYETPWDGTANGNSLVSGIYYYNIQMSARGVKESKTGYITLIK
ncbi:IPT/TIG domain-containing protein [uncultured Microscilla sp.]|uniref:IPT/TIG domain-containing protein n=1 Tax=uncultured Microscilla sp. TaxID=432653 RepID=UPI00262520A6|nr:IPT/TIG domain-containing protein [uncultured Microscilla sp.]